MNRFHSRRAFAGLALGLTLGLALLATSPLTQAAAAAEHRLLDDRAAWTLGAQPEGARWDGDALLVPALADGNAQTQQALRTINLGPAASWRAEVRLAAVQPAAADAALGMVLVDSTGTFIAVMLRPQERDLVVIRSIDGAWRRPLMGFVPAPMLAGAPTAPHVLSVQSQASRLRISIDGQVVVTTPLMDFRPVQLGLRASNTQARADQWLLQETGQDSRLARLAGLAQAPGTLVSFEDKLADGHAVVRSAQSLFSGVTSLFSSTPPAKAQPDAIDSSTAWPQAFDDAHGAFNRDTARKRLVLQSKTDDSASHVNPDSLDAGYYAGVAVQATLNFPVLNAGGAGGVVLIKKAPAGAPASTSDELIFAQVTPTELRLYERTNQRVLVDGKDTGKTQEKWQLIDSSPHGGVAGRTLTLRLAQQNQSAWVFIDGRLLIAADNVKRMAIDRAGLRTEGVATMEASHFLFSEM